VRTAIVLSPGDLRVHDNLVSTAASRDLVPDPLDRVVGVGLAARARTSDQVTLAVVLDMELTALRFPHSACVSRP